MSKKKATQPTNQDAETRKNLAKRELQRELMEAVPGSAVAEKKRRKQKKQMRNLYYALAGAFVFFFGWWLFKPYQSSMPYGICKVFVELYVPYPRTVHYSQVENFSSSVRIWFSKVDGFGQYRLEPMQCYFKPPENGAPYELSRVTIGRREVDPYMVERFNRSIPVIVANPPDLTYPTKLPDSLEGLQFDFDEYRKQIFDR